MRDMILVVDGGVPRWTAAAVVDVEAVHGTADNAASAEIQAGVVFDGSANTNLVATAAAAACLWLGTRAHARATLTNVLTVGSDRLTDVLTIMSDRLAPEGTTITEEFFDAFGALLPNGRVS